MSQISPSTPTPAGKFAEPGVADELNIKQGLADQVFLNESTSARSVSGFSRNAKPFGLMAQESFEPMFDGPRGLSNPILALQGGVKQSIWAMNGPSARSGSDALGQFWDNAGSTGEADYFVDFGTGAKASVDSETPSSGNVAIPLPAAAWSALTVMGGMGVLASLRRALRRVP